MGGTIVAIVAACGSEGPSAPVAPPIVTVDWAELQHLYDDPLYLGLAQLIDDESVARALQDEISALVAAIQSRNLSRFETAMSRIHAIRTSYANRPGADRHEEPQLLALSLFEIRGAAYIQYDSLQQSDTRLRIEGER